MSDGLDMDWDDDDGVGGADSDSDGVPMDDPDELSSAPLSRENSTKFLVLSSEEIVGFMVASIKDVNEILKLPITTARILLSHFRWDQEKLLERYYGNGEDTEKLFREAHVLNPHRRSAGRPADATGASAAATSNSRRGGGRDATAAVTRSGSGRPATAPRVGHSVPLAGGGPPIECPICFLAHSPDKMTGLGCGHVFCRDCWFQYLRTKILDEGIGQGIFCMAPRCDIIVDDETAQELLKNDTRVKSKYFKLITNSFVECNKRLRWCPAADCGNAIQGDVWETSPATCTCGSVFCFRCGQAWHEPVTCQLLARWIKKCDDDSETSNWIAANTKECPKCKAVIEKDGGCNHMTCKNQSCRHDFCWVCLSAWNLHGSQWYNCNRYNESEAKKARAEQEKSRALLNRYIHYFNRYSNHQQSLKFENKLYRSVNSRMEDLQQNSNMSWIEVQFLKQAVDVLVHCRQTLMYTYVFAYYLKKNNHSEIFEQNQADLERYTEVLSHYLERDIQAEMLDPEKRIQIKQTVQDKNKYCESRRETLIKHVHEGYDKNYWEFNYPDSR